MPFFESVRLALSRHPVGVHDLAAGASPSVLKALAERLPTLAAADFREFLSMWNGGSMFHESLVLRPAAQIEALPSGHFLIGESSDGTLWLDRDGRVLCVDPEEPDPILAGQHFADWIDVVMAREALLLDRDGEFRDVFEEEDGVLRAEVRRKRAQIGRKRDPEASLFLLELAELALEDGDDGKARELLEGAVSSGGPAGPAWELLAALQRQAGDELAAHESYLRAAQSALSNPLRAMRFLEAAQLAPTKAAALVEAATKADPDLADRLLTQVRESLADQQIDEAKQLVAKLQLLSGRLVPASSSELARIERDLRSRDALRVI